MPLIPIEVPPGVYKNSTDMMAKDRWTDVSLVRFHEGGLRPVGGWRERVDASTPITEIPRKMLAWRTDAGDRFIAVANNNELHVIETNDTVSDITPAAFSGGFESSTINTGYGGDVYGSGLYGMPRDDNAVYTEASTWALDTWGEYLVGCNVDDGKLYEWQLDTATAAAQITNSPTSCESLLTTEERFLFALGASGNPRQIKWSDREDNTTWTAAATNQAGDIELQTVGGILAGVRVRGQALILTDVDAHTATFTGGTAVYSFQRVGTACGLLSRNAVTTADGAAYWMGQRGFFRYAGGAVEPLPSEVGDYVFTNLNRDKASHIWAVTNAQFGEVWFFYVDKASTEVDRYVVYNYREGHWNIGALSRTCGIDRGVMRYPLWTASGAVVYEHEYGTNHGGDAVYAETGPIMIGTGDRVMVATELFPDEEVQAEVTATFKTRFAPNGTEYEYGPYSMSTPTSVRFTGRQVRMRVDSNSNEDWRVGIMRLDVKEGGRR